MVLKIRELIYDLLTDVYYRFTISFGYLQYATRDMDRKYRKFSNHTYEWERIENIMRNKRRAMPFLWDLKMVHGRDWPYWYNQFQIPLYTDEDN